MVFGGSRVPRAFPNLPLSSGCRLLRELHEELRSADDISIKDNLWNGIGVSDGIDLFEKLCADRVVFDVEGEVGDVILGELVFEVLARRAPLGNEGDDAGGRGLAYGF